MSPNCTNSHFLIPISLHSKVVKLTYFKLLIILLDQIIKLRNIKGKKYQVAKTKEFTNLSLWQRHNFLKSNVRFFFGKIPKIMNIDYLWEKKSKFDQTGKRNKKDKRKSMKGERKDKKWRNLRNIKFKTKSTSNGNLRVAKEEKFCLPVNFFFSVSCLKCIFSSNL